MEMTVTERVEDTAIELEGAALGVGHLEFGIEFTSIRSTRHPTLPCRSLRLCQSINSRSQSTILIKLQKHKENSEINACAMY